MVSFTSPKSFERSKIDLEDLLRNYFALLRKQMLRNQRLRNRLGSLNGLRPSEGEKWQQN